MKHRLTAGLAITFIVIVGGMIAGTIMLSADKKESKAAVMAATEISTVTEQTISTELKTTSLIAHNDDSASVDSKNQEYRKPDVDKGAPSLPKPSDGKRKTTEVRATEATTGERKPVTSVQTTEARPIQTTESGHSTTVTPTTEGTQAATTEAPRQETTEQRTTESDPTTEKTPEQTTEKPRVWHPAVTKKVWVVDEEAWDETITYTDYETHDVCSTCGAYIDGGQDVLRRHVEQSVAWVEEHGLPLEQACLGAFRTISVPIEKTEVVHHEEEGHWETVVVKEGYWE